jgi:hypothetical protein
MNTGYVKAVLGDAKDHGFRGTINLVGGTKIGFDFGNDDTFFHCNAKNRTLMIGSGSTVVFTRKYIDCSSIQYIETIERIN